ncbi:hypothetical protein LTR02_017782 [Friedmanniomyces endolithicus]|nr:hypothetical protein LTR94_022841 [Friedmanniomyces endolithicus]KAK0768367.1 hypothetical protein LTR59_017717 [Friedmanniomyces endolithicus]KAK0770158.1 hypothetical protein LTR38_017669 [Friedmanniomyces endolithicus]KAK0829570.1 hypothetical protein LTR03_016199 [Friedmanniomyces endolithicus]KAK0858393.1 hypothetical protein LTR87_017788 [Friedmanniomyces endolithicus]
MDAGEWVVTDADWATYTHVIYLDLPPNIIAQRRHADTERIREFASDRHLARWQEEEKRRLRIECYRHTVLLSILSPNGQGSNILEHVRHLLTGMLEHPAQTNTVRAEARLNEIVGHRSLETMIVMDGDRTLAADDTGALFGNRVADLELSSDENDPLKAIFASPMGYTCTAFQQATYLYEDLSFKHGNEAFDILCETTASVVTNLLELTTSNPHAGAVVLTCGHGLIWEKVLKKAGLSDKVEVIGGGRLSNGYVITPMVKGALVVLLRHQHQINVWSFGDSRVDMEMLKMADRAVVVVGEEHSRSKSLDAELLLAIERDGLQACQILLPGSAPPRLDTTTLPVMHLTEAELESISRSRLHKLQLLHATGKASAKLLTTRTRDATIAGPALRKAHEDVGYYLAIEFVSSILGLEESLIPHVQNHQAVGHRLRHERERTLIVALMRGGEPMALGVSKAFPQATFAHARSPEDLTVDHVKSLSAIILVDSVINEGLTVKRFVEQVRRLHATLRSVVVANVVQADSVGKNGSLAALAHDQGHLSLVALRLSENKYTGRGTSDTGNRLFNTTHLKN